MKNQLKKEIEELKVKQNAAYNEEPTNWDEYKEYGRQINSKIEELMTIEGEENYSSLKIDQVNLVIKALLDDDVENGRDKLVEVIEDEYSLNFCGFKFEWVNQEGGEGEGDGYHVVFSAEKDGSMKYFKVDGWYASHNGHELEYDSFFEVEPYERTVQDWKAVN